MKRLALIGNSVAAAEIIEQMLKKSEDWEIHLFSQEGITPYDRNKFAQLINEGVKKKGIAARDEEFYKQPRVLIYDENKVTRVNFKRKRVYTEKKVQVEFDKIVFCGPLNSANSDIKGNNKTGIYGIYTFPEVQGIFELAPLADTVVIQCEDFAGASILFSLLHWKREIYIVTEQEHFLADYLNKQASHELVKSLYDEGVHVVANSKVVEALGETEIKAVRLDPEKVIGSQLLVLNKLSQDFRMFKDTELETSHPFAVTENMQTDVEGCYAVDMIAKTENAKMIQGFYSNEFLLDQATRVVKDILGDEEGGADFFYSQEFQLGNNQFILLGDVSPKDEQRVLEAFDSQNCTYQRYFLTGQILTGAVLMNLSKKKDEILNLIQSNEAVSSETLLPDMNNAIADIQIQEEATQEASDEDFQEDTEEVFLNEIDEGEIDSPPTFDRKDNSQGNSSGRIKLD